jgi:hypothetical protein
MDRSAEEYELRPGNCERKQFLTCWLKGFLMIPVSRQHQWT